MPMVIPVIAAFAAGGVAATAIAAGTLTAVGTVAAYATIAGAVLTGVGAVTGSKDLMKIGAVLSIGGGIASLASGAATAAEATAAGATAEGAAAGAEVAATASPVTSGSVATTGLDPLEVANASQPVGTMPAQVAPGAAVNPAMDPNSLAGAYKTDPTAATLDLNGTRGTAEGVGDYGKATGYGAAGTSIQNPALAKVAEGAGNFNAGDLASWWEKAKNAGGAVGAFIEKNPALVKVGGDMLASMYGPQAERLDLEKSLMERARKNLNSPIKLAYSKPGG